MRRGEAIFEVAEVHRSALVSVATDSIRSALEGRRPASPEPGDFDDELARRGATFVTLETPEERLLGCIGTIEPVLPLVVDVAKNAVMAAFRDYRTSGVGPAEFETMSVKISVLSPLEPVPAASFDDLAASVQRGVDGLLLDAGTHHSTLLPSVWPKVADVDEFLAILWAKAGLPAAAWPRGTVVQRYTTVEFGEYGPRPPVARR